MTAQMKNRILSIIAGKIRENGSMKLNQLTRALEENGFTREIYGGTGPKKWLQANLPEVEILGSNGKELLAVSGSASGPAPAAGQLTEAVRREYVAKLTGQLETYGILLHSSIPELIPDWSKYKVGGERLGAWLARVFPPEEFATRIVNNAAALLFPNTAADIDRIVQIVNEMIMPTGVATIVSIAAALEREDLAWQSIPIAHNQTLGEWLMDYCTGIAYTDASETALRFTQSMAPADIVAVTDAVKQSVVYKYVFLPSTGLPLTALRELMGNPAYSTADWRKQSISVCYDNLMGLGEGFLDDSGASDPRIAFYTGLQTPDQQHIYCIITPNDVKSAVQRWRGGIFRYPGQSDPEGYGRWLCQRFGLTSENKDAISGTYQSMETAVEQIETLQAALLQYFEQADALVRSGDPISAAFSAQIAQYIEHWESIRSALRELGMDIPTEESPMAFVKDVLNKKGSFAAVLEAMRADYQTLVTEAWEYLDETVRALYNEAAAEPDIAKWDECLNIDQMSVDEIRSKVMELLSPFGAMRVLAGSSIPLSEPAKRAWDVVEQHFEAELRPRDIRIYFSEAKEGTLDFLNKIGDIENRLKQLEMDSGPVCETEMARLDPPELIRQVLNTENIHLIHQHYPAANAFEAAVVTGEFNQAREIAADPARMAALGYSEEQQEYIGRKITALSGSFSTPVLAAGINLNQLQGNANSQAEKYLLLAVALRDGNAAAQLMDLYYGEDDAELLWPIYNVYGKDLAAEVRQKYLTLLIDREYVSVPEIMVHDIVGFLSIRDGSVLDAFCCSSQLTKETAGRLQQIRQAMQIPFIRQIVFLDTELYRFIQQQENIEGIQLQGIHHTSETLGDLLRIGNYPRGQDAMSTAQRLWYFLRDWNGLAETFAMLSGESAQRTNLLWDIYQTRNDREQMLSILRQTPELQAQNFEVYCDLLFTSAAYQEYFDIMAGVDDPTLRMYLQFVVAGIQTGQWDGSICTDLDTTDLANTTEVIVLLAKALTGSGHIGQFGQFLQAYFDAIVLQCGPETIEQIVTAGGGMDESALRMLQEQAIGGGHTALAVFLSRLLGDEDTGDLGEAYYQELWDRLEDGDPAVQARSVRKLQLLFPARYEQHYARLFPYLIRSRLTAAQNQQMDEAAVAAQMLTPECVREDTLAQTLQTLKETGVIVHTMIQDKLFRLCDTRAQQELCMRFFHENREEFGEKADRTLCRLYDAALRESAMPQEYLAEAEEVALRQIQKDQDNTAAWCVCAIEEILGREPYHKFAQMHLQDARDEEEDDLSESEDTVTELSLLRQVLEDPAYDIGAYLKFCSAFGLYSASDREIVKELLRSGQEGALTEAESIPLLHGLYENSRDTRYLAASARLPFRDNPKASARMLFYGAMHSESGGISWKTCADYCEKFRQDDILLDSLLAWLRQKIQSRVKTVQWFDAKETFFAIRNLCNRPEGFPQLSRPESARELLEEMCAFFIRIDANSTTSDNHISLRTIIELAVASGNEDIVTDQLRGKLLGLYRKLGLVFACHLLQRGRYDSASRQLQELSRCHGQMMYKDLVTQLAAMDHDALAEWTQSEVSQMLLKYFILPDGNRPDAQMLRRFLMACITQDKRGVGIRVAEQLIGYFENDSICYKVLFILCKDDYMTYQPQIQRALAGLYVNYPVDRRGFYTRSREDMLTLLTVVSAVMQQQGIPQTIGSLNDFIHKNSVMDSREISTKVAEQLKRQDAIIGEFVGLTEEQRTLLIHSLMCNVTANWAPFLSMAFESGIQEQEMSGWFRRCNYSWWGLVRGTLLVYRNLAEKERRTRFLEWMKESLSLCEGASGSRRKAMNVVTTIVTRNKIDQVDVRFLQLPWEEHMVCMGEMKYDTDAELMSCYSWLWDHMRNLPEGCAIAPTLHVYNRIAQDQFRIAKLYTDTNRSFDQGEFALASQIYDVLDMLQAIPDDCRGMQEWQVQQLQRNYKEFYQARSRICKIFLNEPAMIDKFRTMKAHSCVNVVVTLLRSCYAGKLRQVVQYFNGANRRLCYVIVQLVNPNVPDREKLALVNEYEDDSLIKNALAWILSARDKETSGYLFVKSAAIGEQMAANYRAWLQSLPKPKTILTFDQALSEWVFNQLSDLKEADFEGGDGEAAYAAGLSAAVMKEEFLPAFAVETHSELQEQELPSLETLRAQMAACHYDDYDQQLRCAGAIYHLLSMDSDSDSETNSVALLQLGQAYRNFHLSRLSGSDEVDPEDQALSRTKARKALLDMAYYQTTAAKGRLEKAPIILYAEGLQGILYNDFDNIDDLVDDYRKNRDGYQALMQLITDVQVRSIVQKIFKELQRLAQHYEIGGPKDQNTASYRASYKQAYDELEQIPFHLNWNEAKNTLLKHLMRAINSLDKRPYLDVKVLNDGTGNRTDAITGVLTNTGRVVAENITIQAIYADGIASDIYGYKELLPNEQICFAVSYSAPEDALTLPYTLNITYSYRDKEYMVDPRTGTLELTQEQHMAPDSDLYGAHRGLVFTTDGEGKVVSKGFYGRSTEKNDLQKLAPENAEFCDYRSSVIQGFRRTGKTSLLYYFKEHIRSKCAGKAVAIYVDCEGFKEEPVQKAFVTSVLFGLENELPELSERESWHRLKKMWQLAEGDTDRNPDTLQFFYQALGRELDGKGVVLIVDEVDRLFERVEETRGAASSLFPSLRAVQNNPDCRKVICLQLCGSNNMLIYNQDGGKLHQMFQNFAKIQVGQLHREDVQKLLADPLAETGEMEYHPEAIEWIWRYTGGLVWYTKLLGNAAVNHAKSKSRRVIYPIDVSIAFDSIVNEQNCKQYIDEGCSEDEKVVLDAMATLATRYGADVSLSQLSLLLGGILSEGQLDSSLKLLTDTLGLLERSVNNRNTYHFAVEIYRRFYRTLHSRFHRTEALADRMSIQSLSPAGADAAVQRSAKKKRT